MASRIGGRSTTTRPGPAAAARSFSALTSENIAWRSRKVIAPTGPGSITSASGTCRPPGDQLELYLDGLVVDGQRFGFDADPGWDSLRTRRNTPSDSCRPFHDFGYSRTNYAGGQLGEIGGVVFRDERPSYYAAPAGLLTLDDELVATGRFSLNKAGSDSGVYIGWFNSAAKQAKTTVRLRAAAIQLPGGADRGAKPRGALFPSGLRHERRPGTNRRRNLGRRTRLAARVS